MTNIPSFHNATIKNLEAKRLHFLEKRRGYLYKAITVIVAGYILVAVALSYYNFNFHDDFMFFALLFILALPFLFAYPFIKIFLGVKETYRGEVVSAYTKWVLETMNLDWDLFAEAHKDSRAIKKTKLLRTNPTSFHSTGLFKGYYHGVPFHCSEMISTIKTGDNSSTDNFKGIMLEMDREMEVSGTVVIVPDMAQSLLGMNLGKKVQQLFAHKKMRVVHFDNMEFEEKYAVYAEFEEDARFVVDPDLTERLLHSLEEEKLYLSIQPRTTYLGIDNQRKNYFNYSMKRSLATAALYEQATSEIEMIEWALNLMIPEHKEKELI